MSAPSDFLIEKIIFSSPDYDSQAGPSLRKAPITDIIFLSSAEQTNPSYEVITETLLGGSANLLGSKYESLFLAYSTETSNPPLRQLTLREGFENRSDPDTVTLPPIFVKRENKHISIAFSRAGAPSDSDEDKRPITSIDLVNVSSGHGLDLGEDYELLEQNVYCGKEVSRIQLLIGRQVGGISAVRFFPLIERVMGREYRGAEGSVDSENTSLVSLESVDALHVSSVLSPLKLSAAREPEVHYNLLTNERGAETHTISLVYTVEVSEQSKKAAGAAASLTEEETAGWFQGRGAGMREENAITIFSHVPAHRFFKNVLMYVYDSFSRSGSRSGEVAFSLEDVLYSLMFVNLARRNNLRVELECNPSLSFALPSELDLPFQDLPDFLLLFSKMSITNIVWAIHWMLLERSLLFVGSEQAVLPQVLEQLRVLIFPFEWQFVFLPNVGASVLELLESPLPFVAGCITELLGEAKKHIALNSNEVVLFDIDMDLFGRVGGGEEEQLFALGVFDDFLADLSRAGLVFDASDRNQLKEVGLLDVPKIRTAFLKLMVQTVTPNYIEFLRFADDPAHLSLDKIFATKKYLRSFRRKPSLSAFMAKFVESELFHSFVFNSILLNLKSTSFYTHHNPLNFFKCCCMRFKEKPATFVEDMAALDSMQSLTVVRPLSAYLADLKIALPRAAHTFALDSPADDFDRTLQLALDRDGMKGRRLLEKQLRIRPNNLIKFLVNNEDSFKQVDRELSIYELLQMHNQSAKDLARGPSAAQTGSFWGYAKSVFKNKYRGENRERSSLRTWVAGTVNSIRDIEFGLWKKDFLSAVFRLYFLLAHSPTTVRLMRQDPAVLGEFRRAYGLMTAKHGITGDQFSLTALLDIFAKLHMTAEANRVYALINKLNIKLNVDYYKNYSSMLEMSARRKSLCAMQDSSHRQAADARVRPRKRHSLFNFGRKVDLSSLTLKFCQDCVECEKLIEEPDVYCCFEAGKDDFLSRCCFCRNAIILKCRTTYLNPETRKKVTGHFTLMKPLFLTEEVSRLLVSDSDPGVDLDALFRDYPQLFWNCVYYFTRLGLSVLGVQGQDHDHDQTPRNFATATIKTRPDELPPDALKCAQAIKISELVAMNNLDLAIELFLGLRKSHLLKNTLYQNNDSVRKMLEANIYQVFLALNAHVSLGMEVEEFASFFKKNVLALSNDFLRILTHKDRVYPARRILVQSMINNL